MPDDLRGIGIRKDLEVIGVSDLLARIHVDQHGHRWIHPADREAAPTYTKMQEKPGPLTSRS